MNPTTFDRRQSQEVDRRAAADYGVSTLVLMENAGRGLADKLVEFGVHGPVAICCGGGNNGGDGFVLARHLDLRRVAVRVGLWAAPHSLRGDAAANFAILRRCDMAIEYFADQADPARLARLLDGVEWIVDALLGTGARGEPRPPLGDLIDRLNAHPAPKLAVDLPSGLDCDTGAAAAHTIRAQHTCTFVAPKRGFLAAGAAAYTGAVHVLDIGAPRKLVDECLAEAQQAPS